MDKTFTDSEGMLTKQLGFVLLAITAAIYCVLLATGSIYSICWFVLWNLCSFYKTLVLDSYCTQ